MSPVTVFFRTLLKSSAIFIGAAAIFLHPSLEWGGRAVDRATVGAQQSAREAAIAALIDALTDQNTNVRIAAMDALGEIGDARALEPLTQALKDKDATIRRHAALAIARLSGAGGPNPRPEPRPRPRPNPHPAPVRVRVR